MKAAPSISAAFPHPDPALQLPGFSSMITPVLGIRISMDFILRPWQLFFLILSGWVNRQQQEIIEFQNAQIRALMDKMGRKRILLSDDQRRVLAAKGKALGRKPLMELTTIVTPDTILRWHRQLIAKNNDYILVVMRLKSRRVEIAGITENPNGDWIKQIARNLTDCEDGFLRGTSHILVDRDTTFQPFRAYMNELTDTEIVLLPPKSPNLNAQIERYMRSLKSECLNRMIFFGRRSLERALKEFVSHYHEERNHQGLENRLIDPGYEVIPPPTPTARRRGRNGLQKEIPSSPPPGRARGKTSMKLP